jgi:hypothetical protein
VAMKEWPKLTQSPRIACFATQTPALKLTCKKQDDNSSLVGIGRNEPYVEARYEADGGSLYAA